MTFTFIDMAGKTLFVREDAERASWTQEEMSLDLEFPRVEGKVISIGQRVFFKDPSTGSHQIYEVKQAKTTEPDHVQMVTAENICISELSDEHIDNSEITDKTAKNALQGVLNGTLWNVGTYDYNPTSSGDISRGSVWQAVLEITDNWNVYIEPRVTLSANGTITRYLDIKDTKGEFNGVRLSINKNMLDPSVTYDDSNVVTAMFGYGGTITSSKPDEENTECNFADIVWTKTADHPAKPKGQKYIEYPAATSAYGRNGRPRFGFYQNADITDPEILLQKTWECLKNSCEPSISIEGTVADLYRMGYADQPIKLHDIALVEVNPAGFKSQIQIIRMTVDLLDPSATTLTIGSYIPNIIYIERKTNESATGGRGGGGGNSNEEDNSWKEFRTTIQQINAGTALRFQSVQNDIDIQTEEIAIQTGRITVAYNRIDLEVQDRRNADNELNARISIVNENTIHELQLVIENKTSAASIVAGINDQSGSYVKIKAATINLTGYVTVSDLNATNATIKNLVSGNTQATKLWASTILANNETISNRLTYLGHTIVSRNALAPDGVTTIPVLGWF